MKHSIRLRVPFMACVLASLFVAPIARADEESNPLQALRAYSETHGEPQAEAPAAPAPAPAKDTEIRTGSLAQADTSTASARERMLPLIEKAARENDIPVSLLDAVVRVESRYNPNV